MKYTAIIEIFCTDTESNRMHCPVFRNERLDIVIDAVTRLCDQFDAQPNRLVDHARIEDSDETVVWVLLRT